MFAVVAVLLALGSASAGRGLLQRRLPPLPIDPRTEAMAATITTAGTLAAARPLFSPVDIIMVRTCSLPQHGTGTRSACLVVHLLHTVTSLACAQHALLAAGCLTCCT